ncbi:MAG: hypothetical protein R6T98_07355 [Desulfatiglandales bacterium]
MRGCKPLPAGENHRINPWLPGEKCKPIIVHDTEKALHFIPDYAVGIVTRVEKPQRNEKLERFCAEGIFVNMLRSKIVKQAF